MKNIPYRKIFNVYPRTFEGLYFSHVDFVCLISIFIWLLNESVDQRIKFIGTQNS